MRLATLLFTLLLAGCASLSPRFPTGIAAALARDEMRKMETPLVELYYPAGEREVALRVLSRLEPCLERLRALAVTRRPREKARVYLTTAEFNNAFVYPSAAGFEQQMVLPHHLTVELFNWYDLGLTNVGDVACHEAVHYVQMQQVDEFWDAVNAVGGNVLQPNSVMDSWFLEGLATYYEGRLGARTGRTHNPIWTGSFLAGVASRGGRIEGGDLSSLNREMLPFGGSYLVGMHFVDFLARRYGEEKLWKVVDLQGRSLFAPLAISLRFRKVYGKTLEALLDEYSAELRATVERRVRPESQRVIAPDMGYAARIATSRADGAIATLTATLDDPDRLTVREADGAVRFSRGFTPLLPERAHIASSPLQASGLSFSPDGRSLFVTMVDVDESTEDTSRLLELDARSGELLRGWDLGAALGGAAGPDGHSYVFVEIKDQRSALVRLDLRSGRRESLTELENDTLAAPEYSPDGKRLAFVRRVGDSFNLFLREESGETKPLTGGARFDYFPHWLDDERLLFLRDAGGRMQVHVIDLRTGEVQQATDAPFVAMDPVPGRNGTVLFLNREGWGWTLDAAPLPAPAGPPREADQTVAQIEPAQLKETAPEQAAPEQPQIRIDRDSPYSSLDGLLAPSLRAPFVYPFLLAAGPDGVNLGLVAGLSLKGSDRLGYHNYALNVSYVTGDRGPTLDLAYGNHQLAPWWLVASAQRIAAGSTVDLLGTLLASRPFWDTPVFFALQGMQRSEVRAGGVIERLRLVGPSAGFDYFAGESRPYGGYSRAIGVSLAGTWYPDALGSDLDMGDVRAELTGYVPLPWLKRHSLRLHLIGRTLPGAPDGLLQVGGIPRGFAPVSIPSRTGEPRPDLALPYGASFTESLRGYEDHSLRATAVAIAGARYRYPFIIDRGFTSLLYLFPSVFMRQVELELFAEAAYTNTANRWHRAAGAAILFRLAMLNAPFSLYLQAAQRFDDGLGPAFSIGFTTE